MHTRKPPRRPVWIGAAVLGLLALGAGCSGSSAGETAGSSTSTTTTTATADGGTVPDTTVPDFTGESSEGACEVARSFQAQFAGFDPSTLGPAEREQALHDAHATLVQLEAAASPEIAPDVAVLRATLDQLLPLLAAVEFDPARLGPEGQALLSDPAFTTATTNLNAYISQVCAPAT